MKSVAMVSVVLGLMSGLPDDLIAAESYLVVDHESGHILSAKNADTPRQVASLTKIASVMVALEWIGLNGGERADHVTVTDESISGGANPLTLKAGDRLPLETALFAAMMASDNTSASALAEHFGNKIDPSAVGRDAVAAFVGKMNILAGELGMEKTHFINPHGLDGESVQGVSTASDMARLVIHAYDHPDFPGFCREREKTVTVFREGKTFEVRLVNTNELVGSRGIDGTKTGTTWRSGECLIASATRETGAKTRRLISVVLKSEDRFRETVLLLNEGWSAVGAWQAKGGAVNANDHLRKRVK